MAKRVRKSVGWANKNEKINNNMPTTMKKKKMKTTNVARLHWLKKLTARIFVYLNLLTDTPSVFILLSFRTSDNKIKTGSSS
jgi:hypothetical protein